MIKRINIELENGWNPWLDGNARRAYKRFSDLKIHFLSIAKKKVEDKIISKETIKDYSSYLKNFEQWLIRVKLGDVYAYKIDRLIISRFLDYIYIERNRGALTRNNYLNFLRVFFGFAVEHDYINIKPTEGIKPLPKPKKKRTVIDDKTLEQLFEHLHKEKPHYLLAVYFVYYTFIRPIEISKLQVKHINYRQGTIYLPGEITKNKKDSVVTIPEKLGLLLLELKIYTYPSEDYIFGTNYKPNREYHSEKHFRDYWLKLRKEFKMPSSYQFYSLKDTGITHMLERTNDTLLVRDQARHHSIAITDLYTRKDQMRGNEKISKLDY